MKKDNYRDMAVLAFFRYANRGMPTHEQYEAFLRDKVKKEHIGEDPKFISVCEEKEIERYRPAFEDIDAITRMFSALEAKGQSFISEAVRAVYLVPGEKIPSNRDLYFRVVAHAVNAYADISTVYRWLKKARDLYVLFRGFEIDRLELD